jgi:5-(carboxyamino)imidazole ribonucleotide mutase
MSDRSATPLVGVIMGSRSDWETMSHGVEILQRLSIPHEVEVVSAHRTPDKLFQYAESAKTRGLEVIIAGAGGAAHLPGMVASLTVLSIAQMPAGIPVGTLAIGRAGAANAALLAAAMLGNYYPAIAAALEEFRRNQTDSVLADPDPRNPAS